MSTKPSGNGYRTTLLSQGDIAVSIWARTAEDSESTAHAQNLIGMRSVEDERWRLEQEFSTQQRRAYEQIQARA